MNNRNGRIDRRLQRAKKVSCRYFVLPQRAEDRVLDVLVEKTKIIQEQLGSLPPVIERNLASLLAGGIRHNEVDRLEGAIRAADLESAAARKAIDEELEQTRKRRAGLALGVDDLRKLLKRS